MAKLQQRVFDPATLYEAFHADESGQETGPEFIVPLKSFTWSGPTGCWRFTRGVPSRFSDIHEVQKMRREGLVAPAQPREAVQRA